MQFLSFNSKAVLEKHRQDVTPGTSLLKLEHASKSPTELGRAYIGGPHLPEFLHQEVRVGTLEVGFLANS